VSTPWIPADAVTLHGLAEAQADATPAATALSGDGRELSYGELEHAANTMAHRLIGCGVRRGSRVAIRLPRGIEAIVAQLGVLKAGAAYVPIDPAAPAGWRDHVLDAADAAAVIGDPVPGRMHVPADVPGSAEPVKRPDAASGPDDLAYVIFTSGSTGRAKGVAVRHSAIVTSTLARTAFYPEPPGRFLLVSPLSFDSSLAGIWWTLTTGGILDLAPAAANTVPSTVAEGLAGARGITHLLMTPSLYQVVLEGITAQVSGPKAVIVAGEACPQRLVTDHFRLVRGARLYNEYGPTEAAVWCAATELFPEHDQRPVPIGRSVAGAEILVLGESGHVLPPGCPGELAIAGPGLADGYLKDPELTASRFIPHPGGDGRVYRTGDLGCCRTDGVLEVFGRIDDQVKVRGHRIEPREVEAVLTSHPGVAKAVVRLAAGKLAAYVTPAADGLAGAAGLHDDWARIVDETVTGDRPEDGALDTAGWVSSYTDQPVPAQDMAQWVARTVERLRELRPRRVLELGCGTGMLALRLAPDCDQYTGLDISTRTLNRLRDELARRDLRNVRLLTADAADLGELVPGPFDLVICNSVTQYFANGAELNWVMEGALARVGEGGVAFIGDVRNRLLVEAFHASVVLARSGPDATATELAARLAARIRDEGQLVVDPGWFTHEAARLPGAGPVEVRPRRGTGRDEMTRFRYDAIMHCPRTELFPVEERWQPWPGTDSYAELLAGGRDAILAFRAVPNARTAGATLSAQMIEEGAGGASEIMAAAKAADSAAADPETVCAMAESAGYRPHLSWAAEYPAGAFDLVLVSVGSPLVTALPSFPTAPWRPGGYVNDPLRMRLLAEARSRLVPKLRDLAADQLPAYMQPASYTVIERFPLTPHGKVDIRALPAPSLERPPLPVQYRPPGTETEARICLILGDLLGIGQVGADDDFFQLGGHSLLAVRAVTRINEELGVGLPLGVLCEYPTASRLASGLESGGALAVKPPPIIPVSRSGELPMSAAQRGLWLAELFRQPGIADHPEFSIGVQYQLHGAVDVAALAGAVRLVLTRHEALRMMIDFSADGGNQRVGPIPVDPLECYDLRHSGNIAAAFQRALANFEQLPLDTATGRLVRCGLITLSASDHLFAMRLHHTAVDGIALRILETELETLYNDLRAGIKPSLAEPDLQYGDYAAWQHRHLVDDSGWQDRSPFRECLDYWRAASAGVRPLRLSAARSGDPAGETIRATLAAGVGEWLRTVARERGVTPYVVMLTCFMIAIRAETGDDDVAIASPHAGRAVEETTSMIGMMAELIFVRAEMPSEALFVDCMQAVAERLAAGLNHQHVPVPWLANALPDYGRYMLESEYIGIEMLEPARSPSLTGLTVRRADQFDEDYRGHQFCLPVELLLIARPSGTSFQLALAYRRDLYPAERMRALLSRFSAIVEAAAADPRTPVSRLVDCR
jgi:amino acid adenylation domain-containing protein